MARPRGKFGDSEISSEEYKKAAADANAFFAQNQDIYKKLEKQYENITDNLKEQGTLEGILNGKKLEGKMIAEAMKKAQKEGRDITQDEVDNIKTKVGEQKKFGTAINQILPGVTGMATGIENSARGMAGILGPAAMAVAVFIVLAKLALDYAKAIADTRKELGVSVGTAIKLNAQNRILGMQAKLYGLDLEDTNAAQAAMRQNMEGQVSFSNDLILNFARTAAATGQTSDNLAKTLSVMESVSSASREVLLNQIRTNAAMIQAAGVAPALVMQDVAENMEFFAGFAKEGGQNIIQAGIAARKLGLEMSAVASISEGLLDFESSIEEAMEASMLLGREINTDKLRLLNLQGDQAGVMKEIKRLAGSEADFTNMLQPQRIALAKALQTNVENLSRIVRNQGPAATGAAVAASKTDPGSDKVAHAIGQSGKEGNRLLRQISGKLD